jgi:hypothetical protein
VLYQQSPPGFTGSCRQPLLHTVSPVRDDATPLSDVGRGRAMQHRKTTLVTLSHATRALARDHGLTLSESAIRQAADRNELPCIRDTANRRLFKPKDLEDFAARRR